MQKQLLSVLGSLLTTAGKRQGKIERRTIQVNGDEFGYQIYVPPILDEEKLPVITFLHGIGQRGSGGLVPTEGASGAVARHYLAQAPAAIVLLPQCRQGSYWSDPVMDEMVMNALAQTIGEFGADEKRVYLIGVSMGGYGVWHLASHHTENFAALVSICGGSSITKGDRFDALARKIGEIPAWLFHGADDRIVSVNESRQIVKALESNGGNVKYNEYAGVGHNVWLNVLGEKDLLTWLLAQHQE